ncbi:MAG: type II secretion system F family protein [Candidatus Caldarchaeum sp.]
MAEGMAAGLVGFLVSYWPYLSVAALLLVVVVFYRRFVESERSAAAEREQTLFLTFLYVLVKSGRTVLQAFREAASKKEYMKHLSSVASYLVRDSESRTLSESMRRYVHPSREFTLLVGSLGQDLESGFGVVEKLEKLIEQAISRESDRWRRYIDSVETLGEAVVAVILLIPLIYIVGSLLGGFPLVYTVVIAVAAAAVFYVVSSAAEPLHLVDLPWPVVVNSTALALGLGAVLAIGFLNVSTVLLGLVVGVVSLVWGLFVHFRYVRRAVSEGEGAFLLLDSVAARLRAGYPIGRSLEAVADPRFSRYALSVARGLSYRPLNRFMALAMETVRVARLGGLGAEALSLLARLALAIHLSFTGARARMKLYTGLAIGSGAAIIAVSAIVVLPFTTLPPELSAEILKFIVIPTLEPVLPLAMMVSYVLGIAVGKVEDQTIAATWRAGAGVLACIIAYFIASPLVALTPAV